MVPLANAGVFDSAKAVEQYWCLQQNCILRGSCCHCDLRDQDAVAGQSDIQGPTAVAPSGGSLCCCQMQYRVAVTGFFADA